MTSQPHQTIRVLDNVHLLNPYIDGEVINVGDRKFLFPRTNGGRIFTLVTEDKLSDITSPSITSSTRSLELDTDLWSGGTLTLYSMGPLRVLTGKRLTRTADLEANSLNVITWGYKMSNPGVYIPTVLNTPHQTPKFINAVIEIGLSGCQLHLDNAAIGTGEEIYFNITYFVPDDITEEFN